MKKIAPLSIAILAVMLAGCSSNTTGSVSQQTLPVPSLGSDTAGLTEVSGPVSNVSGQGFTLAANNVHYSITLASGAQVVQKDGQPMDISQLQNGDTVNVWGTFADFKSSITKVQDMSVPR